MKEADIIADVAEIEITTRRLVDGIMTGNYHSVFKGQGIDFSEIREYQPGDDIRTIDWNVTARFDTPHVKEFIEDRDVRMYIVLDVSGSGSFGNTTSKRRKGIEVAACLLFSALRNNDASGLFLVTDDMEKHIPARKGRKHIRTILHQILRYEPRSKKTDLGTAMKHVAKVLKRRSIVFLISDMQSPPFTETLSLLKTHHDVIPIWVYDKREFDLPDVGYIELEDEETGEQILVDTSDPALRKRFSEIAREAKENLLQDFAAKRLDVVELHTEESCVLPLTRFFSRRKFEAIR